jgi:hypothetical protein
MFDTSDVTCCVCISMFTNPVSLQCNHVLCRQCWAHIKQTTKTSMCPLCRQEDHSDGRACREMDEIVRNTGRPRACGGHVTDNNLRAHESKCGPCWEVCVDSIRDQVKDAMVTIMKLKAELVVAKRVIKRKHDECESVKDSYDALCREHEHNDERERRRRRRNNKHAIVNLVEQA